MAWEAFCIIIAAFNQWNDDESDVNVDRNDDDWNDNWWFGGVRNFFHFSPYLGEFCLMICPHQPPRFLPISSSFRDRVIYFLLSKDFVSQRIIKNIFNVSTFLVAKRTYGSFSF